MEGLNCGVDVLKKGRPAFGQGIRPANSDSTLGLFETDLRWSAGSQFFWRLPPH